MQRKCIDLYKHVSLVLFNCVILKLFGFQSSFYCLVSTFPEFRVRHSTHQAANDLNSRLLSSMMAGRKLEPPPSTTPPHLDHPTPFSPLPGHISSSPSSPIIIHDHDPSSTTPSHPFKGSRLAGLYISRVPVFPSFPGCNPSRVSASQSPPHGSKGFKLQYFGLHGSVPVLGRHKSETPLPNFKIEMQTMTVRHLWCLKWRFKCWC